MMDGQRPECCLNCGTVLAGNWCYQCGQRVEAHGRSLRHVGIETVELLTHADSRLWRTLRGLALHPARLTLDYLAGRRASQIPPLRLFLIMLLVFFSTNAVFSMSAPDAGVVHLNPSGVERALRSAHITGRLSDWLQGRIMRVAADPSGFLAILKAWSERFAFMLLPVSTLLLGLIFVADRRVAMFDHVIFSLHSLSFCLAALALTALPVPLLGDVAPLLLLLLPVHLFVHMRGVYGTRPFGTLLRMLALAVGTAIACVILLGALLLTGLQLANG